MDFINGGPAGSQRKATVLGDPTCKDCEVKQSLGGCKKHRKQAPKDQPKTTKPTREQRLADARAKRDRGEPLDLARLLSKEIKRLTRDKK